MSTATATPKMHPVEHHVHAVGWGLGAVGQLMVAARLALMGWTPDTVVSLIGALTLFGMMVVSVIKALQPYFEAWLQSRRGPK